MYYVVNLIIPTSIITLVSITGFFTPASTADDRTEKINLGITTLLAMSILMLMISDQMPTTSDFIPLIGRLFKYDLVTIIFYFSLVLPLDHYNYIDWHIPDQCDSEYPGQKTVR